LGFAASLGAVEFEGEERDTMTPLQEAKNIIDNDREETYGDPGVNIRRIAELWSAYLGTPVTGADVCWMMVLHKASRAKHKPDHQDNETDAIGYIALIDRMRGEGEAEPDPQLVPEPETVEVGDTWRGKQSGTLVTVTRDGRTHDKHEDTDPLDDRVWYTRSVDGQDCALTLGKFLECYDFVSRKEAPETVIKVSSVWTNGYHEAIVTCVGEMFVSYRFLKTGEKNTLLEKNFLKRFTPITEDEPGAQP